MRGVPLERPLARVGSPTTTSCCGSLIGSMRRSTAFTTVKIAVLAPMPRARVSTATEVKAGLFSSSRSAYRRSWYKVSIIQASWLIG